MGLPAGRVEAGQRAAGLLAHPEQDVARAERIDDRLHDRLHQAVHPGPRPEIVPPLQRVLLGQHQVALRGGLVEIGADGHLVGHLAEAVGEGARLGLGVDRVGAMHQQHRHLAAVDRLRQTGHTGLAVGHRQIGPEADRLAHVAGHEVEHVDGGADFGGRRVLRADAARDREAGRGRGKLAGQPLDPLGRNAGLGGRHGRRVGAERRGQAGRRVTLAGEEHIGHGESQRTLGAGPDREPLVGVESGEVHPGRGVDELGHLAALEPVRPGEAALVFERAAPALQEVGPERDDVAGLGEVVRGDLVQSEHLAVSGPERLVVEGLVPDQLAVQGAGPVGQEVGEAAPPRRGEHRHPVARLAQLAGQPADGVVPGDRRQAPVAAARHGAPDPARVVQPLQRRLTAGADLALVDGVVGVPLQLDRAPLASAHVHAAALVAFGAGAGVPGRHAGDLVLRLHQIGHQLLNPVGGASAQCERAAGRGGAEHREEPAAIQRVGPLAVSHSALPVGRPQAPQ